MPANENSVMRILNKAQRPPLSLPRRQQGVLTVFTGVMVLLMLTLMMIFAVRVGIGEQSVSANDVRQKLALHVAETGIQHAKEFFIANSALVASDPHRQVTRRDRWLARTGCGTLVAMQWC